MSLLSAPGSILIKTISELFMHVAYVKFPLLVTTSIVTVLPSESKCNGKISVVTQ